MSARSAAGSRCWDHPPETARIVLSSTTRWPNSTGLELAARLRRLQVSTPILITGYPDENISAKASSAGVRQVLLKPNLEGNLVDCVRNAIDKPDATAP